jgi:formylglycine-generating enzyme required for sulfatase activity
MALAACLADVTSGQVRTAPGAGGSGDMVHIKGACFDMGQTFGGYADPPERPVHRVCVDDFSLDKYEVSNAAFEKYKPGFKASREAVDENTHSRVAGGDENPVVNVTWFEADGYCRSLGKRLPTEAEWEFAARNGGRNIRYPNGRSTLTTAEANFGGDDRGYFYDAAKFKGRTTPVGSYAPSELGLHDLAGNVWEWASDWFSEDYYRISPRDNPRGPASGACRSMRGGAWDSSVDTVTVSSRSCGTPDSRVIFLGFRCAR